MEITGNGRLPCVSGHSYFFTQKVIAFGKVKLLIFIDRCINFLIILENYLAISEILSLIERTCCGKLICLCDYAQLFSDNYQKFDGFDRFI